jgi:hypothetical protein
MAFNRTEKKLAWMSLKSDDTRLPQELRDALDTLEELKDSIEGIVRDTLPPSKGKKWVFSYKHGVGIAMADAGGGSVDYFTRD